jgi:hypothetical protein
MRDLLTALVAAGALFAVIPSQAKANVILDGDFTSPSGGGSFVTYGNPGPMGPWSVGGDSVDLIGGYWQGPPSGGGSVDLNGNQPGAISQGFSATPGNYKLSFYLSVNPDGTSSPTKTVLVSVGNQSSVPFTYSGISHDFSPMNYILEILNFTVTGPTTLTFASADPSAPFPAGAFGPVVGGVDVSATPLPGAILLFGSILAGGSLLLRRRRSGAAAVAG